MNEMKALGWSKARWDLTEEIADNPDSKAHSQESIQSPVQVFSGLLRLLTALTFLCAGGVLHAGDPWTETLSKMPIPTQVRELDRSNCVDVLLHAFRSNNVVRALIFMPGATDEFYLFRRARAHLTNSMPTMLDAVCALTNQTFIRATFQAPFLLLHTTEDALDPANVIQDPKTRLRLRERVRFSQLSCDDKDWDYLEPILKKQLKISLRPWRYSTDSWHFYRHSFAAWNIDGLEALEIAALAGKSKFVLRKNEARFEVDPRVNAPPEFDAHLR